MEDPREGTGVIVFILAAFAFWVVVFLLGFVNCEKRGSPALAIRPTNPIQFFGDASWIAS